MYEQVTRVIKRDGRTEDFTLRKLERRIELACFNLDKLFVSPIMLAQKVVDVSFATVFTTEIDAIVAREAVKMALQHPDFLTLATRIEVTNLHKQTRYLSFSEATVRLYYNAFEEGQERISAEYYRTVMENQEALNDAICYENDYNFDYFALRILQKEYLFRVDGLIVECPQYMLMRVAVAIHAEDIPAAIETYKLMSDKYFLHSFSTIKSAGTIKSILAPSYGLVAGNTTEAFFTTLNLNSCISSLHGQTSIALHNVPARSANSRIQFQGLVSTLDLLNKTATNSASEPITVYLEPWHADICDFLKQMVREDTKLTYVLWVPNLFFKRLETREPWSLMCPRECSRLTDSFGMQFDVLYNKYEREGRVIRRIDINELWNTINLTQTLVGQPLIVYKDNCNTKSNQTHAGTIKCLNSDMSVAQISSMKTPSCCNIAIIALNRFVTQVNNNENNFDCWKLKHVVKVAVKNLNACMDKGLYASPKTQDAVSYNRSIAIGVTGLAEVFASMSLPFDHKKSRELNILIFETIYHAALEESCELAERDGNFCQSFINSPLSRGTFQYDMWMDLKTNAVKRTYDWDGLREKIMKFGVKNSLLVAIPSSEKMSHLLGNTEGAEPFQAAVHQVDLYGESYTLVNHLLARDLIKVGLWTREYVNQLVECKGYIQHLAWIPLYYKEIYKSAWEIPRKHLLAMVVERGHFIDHSEPLTFYLAQKNAAILSTSHICCWKLGLKAGMCSLKPFKQEIPVKKVEFFEKKNREDWKTEINLSDMFKCS